MHRCAPATSQNEVARRSRRRASAGWCAGVVLAKRSSGVALQAVECVLKVGPSEAQPEVIDHLRVTKAAQFQIPQRFGRLLQRLVIERGDVGQYVTVFGVLDERRFEFRARSFGG